MIGKTVGSRYKVLEFVGRGGFAEVYLALDLVSRAVVAVKFLFFREQGPGGAPGEIASRFAREARLATELDHPNLVKAFSSGTFEGGPFLVMEFVEGHTLKDIIDKKSSLTISFVLSVGRQLADVLAYIHAHGVTAHRDVKPPNVMVTPRGQVKLMDLGIAKAVGVDSVETKSGVFLGTPHYISPEQAEGAKHVDGRSDIYSLGVVLYHMLTGDVPFDADSTWGVLRKIMDPAERPRPVREGRPDCPTWLSGVVERAMAKGRDERYGAAAEIGKALSEAGKLKRSEKKPRVRTLKKVEDGGRKLLSQRDIVALRLKHEASTYEGGRRKGLPVEREPIPEVNSASQGRESEKSVTGAARCTPGLKKDRAKSLKVITYIVIILGTAGIGFYFSAALAESLHPVLFFVGILITVLMVVVLAEFLKKVFFLNPIRDWRGKGRPGSIGLE